MLVTDAMPPVGTTDESFEFFGAAVKRTGDRLNAESGSLAGSVLDMAGAVRNTVNTLGVSVEEALRMAALYPAEFLGIADSQGKIEAGYKANLVMLDNNLEITGCWLAGKHVF